MKNFKLHLSIISIAAALAFGGCYTQMASSDYDEERYASEDENEMYYEPQADSEAEVESDTAYVDEGVVINNYYGYPEYSRYYWGYYPSLTIAAPYYYDPFYWPISCVWYPYYPVYYPAYSYYPYYPYYDPYVDHYNGYYERSGDVYRTRNTMAGRTSRDSREVLLTRNSSNITRGTLSKSGREKTELTSNRTRERIANRTNTVRRGDATVTGTRSSRNSTESIRTQRSSDSRVGLNRSGSGNERKSTLRKQSDGGNTGSRPQRQYTSRRSENPKSYSTHRSSSPKSYSSPRSSSSGYSSPRSTSPSGGSSSRGTAPRSSNSGGSGRRSR